MNGRLLRDAIKLLAAGFLVSIGGQAADLRVNGLSDTTVVLGGSTNSQQVQVTSSTPGAQLSFTTVITEIIPSVAWLSTGQYGGPYTTPFTLSVALNLQLSGAGPYRATVVLLPTGNGAAATIHVTYTPSSQGGGGSGLTVSSSTVSISYNTSTKASQSATVAVGGVPSYGATATTANGLNWLLLSDGTQSGKTLANVTSQTLTIAVGPDISNLTLGAYSGSILLTGSDNSQQTITVTLAVNSAATGTGITISTSNASISYDISTAVSQSATITVGGVPTYGATVSTANGLNWLLLSDGTQSGKTLANVTSQTITASVGPDASMLTAGTYLGSIQFTGSDQSQQTAAVTLSVSVSASSGNLSGKPSSLRFAYQTNTPPSQTPPQGLLINSAGNQYSYSLTTDQPWLQLGAPTSGVTPGSALVFVNAASLTANTYNGNVRVTSSGGGGLIPVQLLVTDSPVLEAYPSVVRFDSQGSTITPSVQDVALSASDRSSAALSVVSSPAWVTVNLAGNKLRITPNVSAQATAADSDAVVVSAAGMANSPLSIPLVLASTGGTAGAALTFSSPSLDFQGIANGPVPKPQILQVNVAAGTVFSVSVADSWVTISPTGVFKMSQQFTVSVNPAGLSAPLNYGDILFEANGSTQAVPVTLTLVSGSIKADPLNLDLKTQAGGPAVSGEFTVSGMANAQYTLTSSVSWLKATPTPATTQSKVTVTADPAGLPAGVYQGTVTITPADGRAAVAVTVNFTVQEPPIVSISTSDLTFFFRIGSGLPSALDVPVSGSAVGLAFNALVSSSTTWLSVSPASGITPAHLSVSIDPAGLTPGTYIGTISVNGAHGAMGQGSITVKLTVSLPLPTISRVENAASHLTGPIAPGEIIFIPGTNIGPNTPVDAQVDSTGRIPNQLKGVQVLVNGFPAPIMRASDTAITAIVPYELQPGQTAYILVRYLGQTSNGISADVAATAPGIYTQNGAGTGPAGFDTAFRAIGPGNPALKGTSVIFFLTGEGQTNPAGQTGGINSSILNQLPVPLLSPSVLVDGQPADWTSAGGMSLTAAGLMQLTVRIPATARAGDLPVKVTLGENSTQPGVTVSVK
jgi:uncharacterized protein (TIGR03437 family)